MKLFIAYSRKDEEFLKKLNGHLQPLKRAKLLTLIWYDQKIEVGTDWERAIEQAINSADIIVLLISSDFLASEFAYHQEMGTALDLHEKGQVRVVPVIARECMWDDAPFARLQVLPKDGVPLNSRDWASEDSPYVEIVEAISNIAKQMEEVNLKRTITENQKDAIIKRLEAMRKRIKPNMAYVREFRAVVDVEYISEYFSDRMVDMLLDYYLLFTSYETLPEITKITADDYFVLAVANVVLNSDMTTAMKLFDKALEIDGEDYDAISKKGVCLIYLKRFEEAKKYLSKAIEMKPDMAEPYYNMGIVHRRKQDLAKAIEFYDEAIIRKKEHLPALTNAGYAFMLKGDLDGGIEYHKRALEVNFNYALGHYNLACAYAMKRDVITALCYLKHAIIIKPVLAETALKDTDFERIRHNTQFKKILKEFGVFSEED